MSHLYPEDYLIQRSRLVELLVAEGIIEEKNRKLQLSKGKRMLNKLVNSSLLNNTMNFEGHECVKMHDLIRDMALQITSETPRFLVKAGIGLKSILDEEYWKDDLVKVSLRETEILDIPSGYEPPNCPRLSTLFLSDNPLESIPNNFFLHMKGLNLLDLSETYIHYLPDSLFDLVNLSALILRGCYELKHMLSLAKLKNLRMLDLRETSIQEIPQGMENLVKLRYLDLSFTDIMMIPEEILRKLDNLQYLSLLHLKSVKVRAEDLEKLRKLEHFEGVLYDINHFNAYVRSFEQRRPTNYILQLRTEYPVKVIKQDLFDRYDKVVSLELYNECENTAAGPDHLFLPQDVENLFLEHCSDVSNFRWLISEERGSPSTPSLSPVTFSSLKKLYITYCKNITKLFIIASLPNLEQLHLNSCYDLMEISATSDDNEDPGEEGKESAVDTLVLSKLTRLELINLPELQSVAVIADSLQSVDIVYCPKLKRLPFLDREPFLGSLQQVLIRKSVWDSLEWDHDNAKDMTKSLNRLQWSPSH